MAIRDDIRRGLGGELGFLVTTGLGDLFTTYYASSGISIRPRGPGISRVTFTRGAASITVELQVTRTWAMPASGQIGTATISIPYGNSAASATYIDPHGGSLVTIGGQNGCGDWVGIVTQPKYTQGAIELTAYQPWIILQRRYLRNGRTFGHTTPGYLFTQAWRDAAAGINTVVMGHAPYEVGGPHVESFQFSGQDLWSAITALMDLSECELHIDATTLAAEWCGSYAYTTRYTTVLVAGGNLRNATYTVDGTTRAAEIVALDPRGKPPYRTYLGETAAGHWPAQLQISPALSGVNLRSAADAALDRHTQPTIAVEGDLPITNWDVRERQTVQVVIPWAEFSGQLVTGRVLSRSVNDGNGLMHVVIQVLNAPRVDAPLISGGLPLRGAAHRLKRTMRGVAQLQRATVRYKTPIHGVTDTTGGHVDGQINPVNALVPAGIVDTSNGNASANVGDVGAAFSQSAINDNFASLAARTNTLIQAHSSDQATLNDNLSELAAGIASLRAEILALRSGGG